MACHAENTTGKRQEQQRAALIGRAKRFVGPDIDAVEESGERPPGVKPDRQRIGAVMQQHAPGSSAISGVLRSGLLADGMPAAVEDDGAVDRDLDAADEAGQRTPTRPGLLAPAGRSNDSVNSLRSVGVKPGGMMIRQADRLRRTPVFASIASVSR